MTMLLVSLCCCDVVADFDTCPTEDQMDTCPLEFNPVFRVVRESHLGGEYISTAQIDWNYFHPWVRNSSNASWSMASPITNPVGFYHLEIIAGQNVGFVIEGCMHNGFPGDSGCIFTAGQALIRCNPQDITQWDLFSNVQGGGGIDTSWAQTISGCPNNGFQLLNVQSCPPAGGSGNCVVSATVTL